MNSLYQQLNQTQVNQTPTNVSQNNLFSLFKNSKNPQMLLNNLMNTNPQVKQTMDMVKASSKSPKDLFYEMAKQKGIDPESILNQLR